MVSGHALRWTSNRAAVGPITSTRNPLVKDVVRLHGAKGRRHAELILLEGPMLAEEAVAAGVEVEIGFTSDPAAYPDAVEVSAAVLERLSTTTTPNAVVLVARRPEPPLRPGADLAVLWDVSEPGNTGALIRSAAAFGLDVVVAGSRAADPYSPKALRAGAGGHFHTAVQHRPGLSLADLAGFTTVATVADGGGSPKRGGGPVALLIGNEAHGLPDEVVRAASERWTIPTAGVESLNAAVAGSIAMYEVARTR